MKILVTGVKGQLGQQLLLAAKASRKMVFGFDKETLDITNERRVFEVVRNIRPDVILHTAAYTAVDRAESDSDAAYAVNGYGTRNLTVAARAVGAKLVYVSTDYVFDGELGVPYDEFTPARPINVYGRSKLAGEQFVKELHDRYFIVRTAWLYGEYGNNFVKTMLRQSDSQSSVQVVGDQIGCPTYTADLAVTIMKMMETERYGTYHVTNSGRCTWAEFAREIFRQKGLSTEVHEISSDEYQAAAKRPYQTVLEPLALRLNQFELLPDWQDALHRCLSRME